MTYRVELTSAACREMARLPEAAFAAIAEALAGDLLLTPYRVGAGLRSPLAGSYGLRCDEYRIIYEIHREDPEDLRVLVTRVWHRRDAYRVS